MPLLVADNIAYCTYHYLGGDGHVEKKYQNYLFEKNIRIDVFLNFGHYIPGADILLILNTRLSGPSLSADCKAPRYIGN